MNKFLTGLVLPLPPATKKFGFHQELEIDGVASKIGALSITL